MKKLIAACVLFSPLGRRWSRVVERAKIPKQ
jgi:hypothetical protein